jgi:putative FmdB family regulatory protein
MPLYEFCCATCGRFERSLHLDQPHDDVVCPRCGRPAARVFTPPGVRTAGGPVASASPGDRARYDRARTGEPVVTGPPTGRRLRHHHRH